MPSLTDVPPVSYRFAVIFFAGGAIPNPLDIRFQKVSGISAKVSTESISEGGQNLYKHKLPTGIEYGELVLERGAVIGSPLNIEFNATMTLFKFAPSNVLITSLNENDIPIMGWLFERAYPVEWSVSDLDATSNSIIIDTFKLAYARFQSVRI
jgi:phage tail-like protein